MYYVPHIQCSYVNTAIIYIHYCKYYTVLHMFRQADSKENSPMPFTSINPTNPRYPWNFHEKILRIGGAGKWVFFWVSLPKHMQHSVVFTVMYIDYSRIHVATLNVLGPRTKDGSKFWWLLWFSALNNTCLNICNTVYVHYWFTSAHTSR